MLHSITQKNIYLLNIQKRAAPPRIEQASEAVMPLAALHDVLAQCVFTPISSMLSTMAVHIGAHIHGVSKECTEC